MLPSAPSDTRQWQASTSATIDSQHCVRRKISGAVRFAICNLHCNSHNRNEFTATYFTHATGTLSQSNHEASRPPIERSVRHRIYTAMDVNLVLANHNIQTVIRILFAYHDACVRTRLMKRKTKRECVHMYLSFLTFRVAYNVDSYIWNCVQFF